MEKKSEVVDGGHHDHVILTMPWGFRILVGCNRHSDFGSADLTAVGDLHFPQFTHRGRFGDRPSHSAQHQDSDSEDEPRGAGGDDDLDGLVTDDEARDDADDDEAVDDWVFGTPTARALWLILAGHKKRLEAFDDGGVRKAPAFAHGLQSIAPSGAFKFAEQGAKKTCAGSPERVAEGNGTAVHVDLAHVGAEFALPCKNNWSERFVEFDEVDVVE